MKKLYLVLPIVFLIYSCATKEYKIKAPRIFKAKDEAPLGWLGLDIYKDSTFELKSAGFSDMEVYKGIVEIKADTFFFNYEEEIPEFGSIATYNNNLVEYIDGNGYTSLTVLFKKWD